MTSGYLCALAYATSAASAPVDMILYVNSRLNSRMEARWAASRKHCHSRDLIRASAGPRHGRHIAVSWIHMSAEPKDNRGHG